MDIVTATSHGQLSSGAGYAPGMVGMAFDFDGATGSLKVPNAYSPCLTNHFTIEAWVKARSFAGPFGAPAIVTKEGGTARNIYGFQFRISDTALTARFDSTPQHYSVSYTGSFSTGQWYHVAFTYDQMMARLYVNGQPVAANNIGARTIDYYSTDFRISGDDWGFASVFNGLIDELTVYNRALADTELAAIYNAGASGKCTNVLTPYISSPLTNQSAISGDDAVLSVVAGGAAPLAYQWRWSGGILSGATNSVLELRNVQTNQSGSYWVVVSNAGGAVTSSPAVVTVTPFPSAPCVPPVPGMVGWWRAEGNAFDELCNHGESLTGMGYAAGRVGLAFDFGGFATRSSVVVPNASSLCLSNQFTMEAWIKSRSFGGAPAILSKLGGIGGNNGYEFLFTLTNLQGQFNSPGGPWPEYKVSYAGSFVAGKWYHVAWTYDQSTLCLYVNGQAVASKVIGAKTIATSTSNFRIGADDNNSSYFDGVIDEPAVYNRALSASEIAAIYAAGAGGKCLDLAPPSISTQPASQTAESGEDVTLSVGPCRTGPFSYQWQRNGVDLSGATNFALVLMNLEPNQSGSYSVVISNIAGAVTSSPAVLTVNASLPTPSCVPPASGLVGWWRAEGNALDESGVNHGGELTSVAYAPGKVGQAFDFDGASRSVVISNSSSLCFSNQFTIEAWIKSRSFAAGQSIVSEVGGTGSNMGYEFLFLKNTLQGQFNSPGVGWPGYTISYDGSFIAGKWYHVAWTYDLATMRLYVNGQVVTTKTIGFATVASSTSYFRISADGNSHDYFNGLIDEPAAYNRALSAHEIAAIYSAGAGGKCFGPVMPYVSVPPTNQSLPAGDDGDLSVVAAGTEPLSYQWQWNGSNLEGATASTLVLRNLRTDQSGSYRVVITNVVGAVTSSPAVLTVAPMPPCVTPAAGLIGWWRAEGSTQDELGANHGGSLGRVAYATGRVGQAFDFDGATRSVVVTNASSLCFTNQFTIEAWIQSRSFTGEQAIVSKVGGAGGNNGYEFLFANNTLRGQFNSTGVSWPGHTVSYEGLFVAGKWYHVAWSYDGSTEWLYLNGQVVASNVIGAKIIVTSPSNLRISGDDNNHVYFNGLIDEPAVYNRALSASEIAAIHAAAAGGKCPSPINPRPVLSIVPAEHGIVLAWPLWATNFLLEGAEGLLESGTLWSNLSVIPAIHSNESRVFLPANGTNRFFRLRSP